MLCHQIVPSYLQSARPYASFALLNIPLATICFPGKQVMAMLFIDWWMVGKTTLAMFTIAVGVIGFRRAGKLRSRSLKQHHGKLAAEKFAGRRGCVTLLAIATASLALEHRYRPECIEPVGARACNNSSKPIRQFMVPILSLPLRIFCDGDQGLWTIKDNAHRWRIATMHRALRGMHWVLELWHARALMKIHAAAPPLEAME